MTGGIRVLARRERTNMVAALGSLQYPVHYATALTVAEYGKVPGGIRVDEAMAAIRAMRVWDRIVERSDHALTAKDLETYAYYAEETAFTPETDIPTLLNRHSEQSPLTAAACANHMLIHSDTGLYDPGSNTNPAGITWSQLRHECLRTPPDGLTMREREEDE